MRARAKTVIAQRRRACGEDNRFLPSAPLSLCATILPLHSPLAGVRGRTLRHSSLVTRPPLNQRDFGVGQVVEGVDELVDFAFQITYIN